MAFLIDTNVLSEVRKQSADPRVLDWQRQHDLSICWVSVLTMMEIRLGTEQIRKTDGRFAEKLDHWYHKAVLKAYEGRILPVTLAICERRALLPNHRTLTKIDALLAATARLHNLSLVTRNIKDFEGLGIELLNPWEAGAC